MLLSGCGSSKPVVQDKLLSISVPPPLLACDDAPVVPDPTHATQRDVAVYMVGTWGAWKDCSDNLRAVKTIIDQQAQPATARSTPAAPVQGK